MAAIPDTRPALRPVLVAAVLAAAYLATRIALISRFPWFVDETTFASFAKEVHGDIEQFFIAESDKKGLLPSWLGAVLIGTGISPVTAMRLLAAVGAAAAAVCGGLLMRRLFGPRDGAAHGGPDRARALLPRDGVARRLRRHGHRTRRGRGRRRGPAGAASAAVARAAAGRPARGGRPDQAHRLGRRRRAAVRPAALRPGLAGSAPAPAALGGLCIPGARAGLRDRSIARLTPLYDQPIPVENQRGLSEIFDGSGRAMLANAVAIVSALIGYLTPPRRAARDRGRDRRLPPTPPAAAVLLAAWTARPSSCSRSCSRSRNPRYSPARPAALHRIGSRSGRVPQTRASAHRRDRRSPLALSRRHRACRDRFDVGPGRPVARPIPPRSDSTSRSRARSRPCRDRSEIERRGGPYPCASTPSPPCASTSALGASICLLNGSARCARASSSSPATRPSARRALRAHDDCAPHARAARLP